MRILDRYILTEYLKTFFIIVISFAFLFITIDLIDRMPRLISNDAAIGDMVTYFVLRLPYLMVLTSPIAVLLSGLFLMSNLSKYNESVAIRAAGISIFRMVLPLLIFGVIYSVLIGLFGEYILPKAESKRNYVYRVKIKKQTLNKRTMNANINFIGADNTLYSIGFFDGIRKKLKNNIDITQFEPKNGQMVKQITARSATWNDSTWVLEEGAIRTFEKGSLVKSDVFSQRSVPELTLNPNDFMKTSKKPMQMNYFELSDYIKRMKKIGEKYAKEEVDLYMKVIFPFANLIILFFCVPLASASVRSKGRGMIFLLGVIICFVFLTTVQVFQILGYNEVLPPLMAALLPNIIFSIIGIGFIIKAEI